MASDSVIDAVFGLARAEKRLKLFADESSSVLCEEVAAVELLMFLANALKLGCT